MKPELFSILVCPHCRKDLQIGPAQIECTSCRTLFHFQEDVPVFLAEAAEVVAADHESNAIGLDFEAILRRGGELILHLGAGASATRYPGCVEFEHKIFRHTDVVGDAHALPFRANVFDRVFAFNVFEHLREPAVAAGEILRVLKPGGSLALHTAFLQPLHEAPHHFYNATEFGVREWFRDFEIEQCAVSGNFSPGYTLGFLAASLLEGLRQSDLPAAAQAQIAGSTLGDWANFWTRAAGPPPGFQTLLALPQEIQKRLAAGFELRARKPTATT